MRKRKSFQCKFDFVFIEFILLHQSKCVDLYLKIKLASPKYKLDQISKQNMKISKGESFEVS